MMNLISVMSVLADERSAVPVKTILGRLEIPQDDEKGALQLKQVLKTGMQMGCLVAVGTPRSKSCYALSPQGHYDIEHKSEFAAHSNLKAEKSHLKKNLKKTSIAKKMTNPIRSGRK